MFLLITIPITIAVIITIRGFFSNSEMAVVSSNKIRLKYLSKKEGLPYDFILYCIENPAKLFGTTLVGINLATVSSTALAEYFFEEILTGYIHLNHHLILILPVLIMEPVILIFGEIFPMSIARKYPNITSIRNNRLLKFGYFTFYPFMLFVSGITKIISIIIRSNKNPFNNISREELKTLVNSPLMKTSKKTKEIIKEVFHIKNMKAVDIMIHLNDVTAFEENTTVGEFKQSITGKKYGRFPVYKDSIFDITSTIHIINILGADENEPIKNYTDKLYIIPSSKPVIEILKELKTNRKYMAITVDDYGAACGIVTLEIIAEELIGEIRDEMDSDTTTNTKKLKNNAIFDGMTPLDDFFDITGIDLQDMGTETLNGYLNLKLGRIGRKGDKVKIKNYTFDILDANDRSVKTVKLTKNAK